MADHLDTVLVKIAMIAPFIAFIFVGALQQASQG